VKCASAGTLSSPKRSDSTLNFFSSAIILIVLLFFSFIDS
jgi:hypothetical protein